MLHKQSIKEKLLKGGAWAFAGKVVTAFAGLAINMLLARLLTPEEMGAYFLTFSLVSIAAVMAQLGLTQAVVRLVAESIARDNPGRARQAVSWTMRFAALGCLAVVCFLAFGGGAWVAGQLFHSQLMANIIGLAAVWVLFFTFQGLIAEIFRGFHDIHLATICGGLLTSMLAMLLFLGLWFLQQGNSDLSQVVSLMLVAAGSSAMFSTLILWKKIKLLPIAKGEIGTSEFMHICWPLWITTLTIFVLTQVDIWILGLFRSQEEVAVYGAAVRMVALVTMPLLIVNAVVPPIIADLNAKGKTEPLEHTLRLTASIAGLPALLVLLFFIFFSDAILALFFGEFYQLGGTALAILSFGQLANVWAGSCGLTLMLTGHQRTMMMITIACGLLTIVAASMLVDGYGGVGVASAMAMGMAIQNLSMLIWAKKRVGVWTHAGLRPIIIAGRSWLKKEG